MNAIATQNAAPEHTVHLILQGKGGVGKTFTASLLAQAIRAQGRPVVCVDTDPVNATFAGYSAFDVQRVELMDGGTLNERRFDAMIEQAVSESSDFVIDNGASSFIPLSNYLVENDAINVLTDNGKRVIVHSVITAGQAMMDTLAGFKSLATQLPENVDIVVWLNEFWGEITAEGKAFEEMKVYKENAGRVAAIVRIPRQTAATYGEDVKQMLDKKLTFDQVASGEHFGLMAKQRLASVRKTIFGQLQQIV